MRRMNRVDLGQIIQFTANSGAIDGSPHGRLMKSMIRRTEDV